MWYHPTNKVLKSMGRNLYKHLQFYWRMTIQDQEAIDADEAAEGAHLLHLTDGKRRVFVSQPNPPYDVGDLWDKGNGADQGLC